MQLQSPAGCCGCSGARQEVRYEKDDARQREVVGMQDRKKDIVRKAARKRDNNVTGSQIYQTDSLVSSLEMAQLQLADNAVPSLQIT
jgi:hypothetical protein